VVARVRLRDAGKDTVHERGKSGGNQSPPRGMPFTQSSRAVPPAPYGVPPAPPLGQEYAHDAAIAPPATPASTTGKRRIWPLALGFVVVAIALLVGTFTIRHRAVAVTVTSVEFGKAIASDQPAQVTSAFRTTDPEIFVFVRLNTVNGNPEIRYVVTLTDGIDPTTTRPVTNTPIATYDGTATSTSIPWSVARTGSSAWPTGTYRLDVYLNGALTKTVTFTVTA
jgi:hypothetical protein